MGRPTDYAPAIVDVICDRLADGESLRAICAAENMPNRSTVFRWLRSYPEFAALYAIAREAQADAYADDVVALADEQIIGEIVTTKDVVVGKGDAATIEPVVERKTADAVDRSRLMVDSRKWAAARMSPRKYGNRLEHVGDPDRPIHIEKIERVIVDPKPADGESI